MVALNDDEAQDAVQEALIRAWRYRHRLRDDTSSKAWLAQIARREALRLRTAARPTSEFEDAMAGSARDEWEGVTADIDLERLLSSLEPPDRRLLRLRFQDDLSYQQIANELEIPVGTAKVRLHRLRTRLRDSLLGAHDASPAKPSSDHEGPVASDPDADSRSAQ